MTLRNGLFKSFYAYEIVRIPVHANLRKFVNTHEDISPHKHWNLRQNCGEVLVSVRASISNWIPHDFMKRSKESFALASSGRSTMGLWGNLSSSTLISCKFDDHSTENVSSSLSLLSLAKTFMSELSTFVGHSKPKNSSSSEFSKICSSSCLLIYLKLSPFFNGKNRKILFFFFQRNSGSIHFTNNNSSLLKCFRNKFRTIQYDCLTWCIWYQIKPLSLGNALSWGASFTSYSQSKVTI